MRNTEIFYVYIITDLWYFEKWKEADEYTILNLI